MNGFLSQGIGGAAGRFEGAPDDPADAGHAVSDDGAEKIGLTDEFGGVRSGGAAVNFPWSCDLFEIPSAEKRDAIGESHGFFLIVSDKDESDADFALERFEFDLHLAAEVGVEGGERLVEKQNARTID